MKRIAVVFLGLALAGCAREEDASLPDVCGDSAAVVDALSAAPGPVRVDGRTPVSRCLPTGSSAGDLQVAGVALLESAQRLGRERDLVGLGYLVGALRRGAAAGPGLHLELLRRIEQEARPFRRAPGFERGLRAGRSSG